MNEHTYFLVIIIELQPFLTASEIIILTTIIKTKLLEQIVDFLENSLFWVWVGV